MGVQGPLESVQTQAAATPQPIAVITTLTAHRRHRGRSILLILLVNAILTAGLLEGALALALVLPPQVYRLAPDRILTFVRVLYKNIDLRLIHVDPNCARYDPDLAYTLKPGTCIFTNREFRNEFRINNLGFRDDERSLIGPEVIVLGDSHAMGWGIDQEETFAQLIERDSSLTALNAAVASYGTVREMRALDRMDTSNLKYLVIQYCDNDYLENRSFYEGGNKLSTLTSEEYHRQVTRYQRGLQYYPGKYTLVSTRKLVEFATGRLYKASSYGILRDREAHFFLNALLHGSRVNLQGVRIVVFESKDGFGYNNGEFISTLRKTIAAHNYPQFVKDIVALDLSAELNANYYLLDGHITPRAHRLIADALLDVLRRDAVRPGGHAHERY